MTPTMVTSPPCPAYYKRMLLKITALDRFLGR